MATKDEVRRMLASMKPDEARTVAILIARELDSLAAQVWAFGLAEGGRRALAIVAQMAGELAVSAAHLFDAGHWYAGAALVRQLIETEYLLYLFAQDPIEATRWLEADDARAREMFSPGNMRKRSQGRFNASEYAIHCKSGGHPRPWGARLLKEHLTLVSPEEREILSPAHQWVDLAQHLERAWFHYVDAVSMLSPTNVYPERFALLSASIEAWHNADPAVPNLR